MSSSNKNSKKKLHQLLLQKENLSDILKRKAEYLAVDPNDQDNKKKRVRRPQYIEFEEALVLWSVLVDNAPVHSHEILDTLSNLKVKFFLPNTISHLQPYDARIIQAQYKKLLVHDRIEAYETAQVLEKSVALVTIYDVICFTKKACNVNSLQQRRLPSLLLTTTTTSTLTSSLQSLPQTPQSPIKKSNLTCTFSELPNWMKDNSAIIRGYRLPTFSYIKCINSLFYLHNESVNIWSHFVGAMIFLVLSIFTFLYFKTEPTIEFFETVVCASWNRCDYVGIVALIVGSNVPLVYYGMV
nr:10869_t:CDS:2 [Entrophospora candida]